MASPLLTQATGSDAVPQNSKLLSPHQAPSVDSVSQPKEDTDILQIAKKLYDGAKQARKDRETKWAESWDFYNGKQWGKRNSKKSAPNVNITRSVVQTILPIMTDTSPSYGIMARDPKDFDFAELFVHVMRVWWSRRSMNHALVESLMDACVADVGILKVIWDEELDDGRGDVSVSVRDPKNVYVPDTAVDFDRNCPWVIDEFYMTRGQLSLKFPDMREKIAKAPTYNKPANGDSENTRVHVVSPVNKDIPGPDNKAAAADVLTANEDLRVWELWLDDDTVIEEEKINQETGISDETIVKKKYPHGRMITILPDANLIIQDVESPYRDGEKPFVRLVDTLIPRSFYGDGEVQPLVETQKMINKIFATIMDWANLMTNPCWVIDNDSGVDPDMITNQMGMVLVKVRGSTVMRQEAPSMPPQIFELYHTLMSLADQQSGVHEVTQGRKPVGITAAQAIETLQEAAQTRIRLKERNLLVSLIRLGRLVMSRMLQYYTEPRVIQMTGRDDAAGKWPEYVKFFVEQVPDGEDILYQPMTQKIVYNEDAKKYVEGDVELGAPSAGDFELEVTTGSSMPYLKEQRGAQAMQLWQTKAIDQKAILDILEVPEKDQILQRMQESAAQAPPEQGTPPPA